MQPRQANDGFKPRYRQFHPQAVLWLKNPFDHDVVYQVADELNRPFRYRLPAGATCELPGGSVATLGLKAVVDELIQNAGQSEALRIWDEEVRSKYEADVIVKVRAAPTTGDVGPAGEINLGVKAKDVPKDDVSDTPEEEFPGLTTPAAPLTDPDFNDSTVIGTQDEAVKNEVASTVGNTLANLPDAVDLATAGE